MTTNEKRMALLISILKAESGFQSDIRELSNYSWDYKGTPAILDAIIMKDIMSRYITGELNQALVYEWANFIELRDDIDYSQNEEDLIAEILHELANPETEGEFTIDKAKFFLNRLLEVKNT